MIARDRITGIVQASDYHEHRLVEPLQFFVAEDYGLKSQ